uniref:Rab-GAP TBC domain-containing protein n=1 Tax=Oncorhynchus tshawytscha TaxID=74940 RepID=A0A8C8J6E1_ONCTS
MVFLKCKIIYYRPSTITVPYHIILLSLLVVTLVYNSLLVSGAAGGTLMENGTVSSDNHNHHHEHSKPPLIQHSLHYGNPQQGSDEQDLDQHSLASQDSGIPTLEINHPEHIHSQPGDCGLTLGSNHNDQGPATLSLDQSGDSAGLRKSSTFPRSGYDSVRLFSPAPRSRAGGNLNRSDDISVCSVSSLSTELSATLSASNEDIPDFMVTSDSSAIVTLETDEGDAAQFSDVTLSSSPGGDIGGDLWSPRQRPLGSEEGRPKRLGPLASFFNRSLFAKKVKDTVPVEQKDTGWKLFGRVPPRDGRDPQKIHKECESNTSRAGPGHSPSSPRQSVRKNLDFEPNSTTALILEARPANLPAKPAEEAQKHRQQYEEMVAQAKKRELKEAQKRRKQLELRCKVEESIGNAAQTWNQEILPNWSTMCNSRRVRDLWWQGVPPSVRGKVWSLAVGNELNITHELYNICLARARDKWKSMPIEPVTEGSSLADREASLELIKLDISRTFPHLCIFQQVMFFDENLPKLFAHFKENKLTPDIYLIDWIFTLYSKSLPLDLACRVWDVFCRDGDEFLFRVALGILRLYEDVLTRMDFIHNAQFLTRLPDHIPPDQLFSHIHAVHMTSKNRKWAQVFQALQKEQEWISPVLKR